MMTKHTPGPWQARQHSANAGAYYVIHFDEEFRKGKHVVVASGLEEANARLIAAAPEMRQLIADAIAFLPGDSVTAQGFLDEARALLARVDGAGK